MLGLPSPLSPADAYHQSTPFRSAEPASLLGNYASLQAGKRGQSLLRYKRPGVAWASYVNIKLDPVMIWQDPEDPLFDVGAEDRQKLADKFYGLLHESLSRTHRILVMPLAHTLRIQVALTATRNSNPAIDTISTIMPLGSGLSQSVNFTRQRPSFIGSASLEVKVSDAASGYLLAAGVDRSVGGESINSSTRSWADVLESMEYWADYLGWRLAQTSGNNHCRKPHRPGDVDVA